jgi:hypothetical protein
VITENQRVVIADFDMRFGSMVRLADAELVEAAGIEVGL